MNNEIKSVLAEYRRQAVNRELTLQTRINELLLERKELKQQLKNK
jgi:hypothetical protein